MLNRWIGIATLGLMLSVNAALVVRDLLPDWLAGDPPESRSLQLSPGDEISTQVGIFDRRGVRVGYCWTRSDRNGDLITVRNQTILLPLSLPRGMATPTWCL